MCLGLILCCKRLSDEYILGQKSASLPISSSVSRPRAQLLLTCSDSAVLRRFPLPAELKDVMHMARTVRLGDYLYESLLKYTMSTIICIRPPKYAQIPFFR